MFHKFDVGALIKSEGEAEQLCAPGLNITLDFSEPQCEHGLLEHVCTCSGIFLPKPDPWHGVVAWSRDNFGICCRLACAPSFDGASLEDRCCLKT